MLEKIMLEQIRKELQEKKKQTNNELNGDEDYKKFLERAIAVFENEDALNLLSTPQMMAVISLLGHSRSEAKEIALKIEEEINQKYHFVNLEKFKSK